MDQLSCSDFFFYFAGKITAQCDVEITGSSFIFKFGALFSLKLDFQIQC